MNKFTKIILIFFVYLITYFTFFAFTNPTPDGDSLNYHIPIAGSYLNGNILNPEKIDGIPFMKYSPGVSEGILAVLIILNIPIQLFNVLGVIFLFLVCLFLGKRMGLKNDLSIVFAIVIASLPVMLRWINMQIIDIWLAVFFTLSLLLLDALKKKNSHYLAIGTSVGFLIGSKFSGPLYFLVLLIFYFNKILRNLNLKLFVLFLIPFSLFGLVWYLRNMFHTGNPFYPESFLFFPKSNFEILRTQVWEVSFTSISGIKSFINAGFSEYSLWFFSIFISIFVLYKSYRKKKLNKITKLILIGISNFIIFLFLPSDNYFHIFVSVFRYTFPIYIPIILSIFLYAKEKGKDEYIYLVTFVSLLISPIYEYHPKVILIVLPIALVIYFKIPDNDIKNTLK
ncbi:MAG: hypothetical protein KBD51_01810 [Candidatus Levybacteria bacterium]|nr:hypothetical protein [Candidatus Levybacteria bacterium]